MALHSVEFSVAGVNTANTILWNLKATSAKPLTLLEVGIFVAVAPATAYDLGLIRMNAVGTGTITSTAGQPHSGYSGDAAVGVLETAWVTTKPSRPATPINHRRILLPLTVGAGIIWQLGPSGIVVPTSGGMLLNQITAAGATLGQLEGYVMWDE